MASSLLSGLSGYVDIRLVSLWIWILCTCFLQHLHKVLCCCSGIDFHFSHQRMFISRRQNRTHLLPERYDGCVVPWCLYLRTIVCTDEHGTFRSLEIAPKDEPDLWRSTKCILRSWLIYFDFPIMSSKEALSTQVHLQLTQIISISLSEASKAIT